MSYYREGDYYLIDDQTGFRIRRSRAVVQWDGKIVEIGHDDPPPPTRLTIPPYRQPKLVRATPAPTFVGPAYIDVVPGLAQILGATLGVVASAGSQSVSVASGALEIAGSTPTVAATANVAVDVVAGQIELAGATPTATTTAHVSVAVVAGAVDLAGSTLTVNAGGAVDLAVVAGAVDISGSTLNVTASDHKAITVLAGTAEIVGASLTATATAHKSITVVPGAADVAGSTLTVSVSSSVATPSINGAISVRASGSWATVSSLTQAHTPAAGTTKLLILVPFRAANANRTVTLTWNGVAATEILDFQQTSRPGIAAYTVDAPTTGVSQDAVATFSGNVTGSAIVVVSLKDAGDIRLVASTGANTGTTLTPSGSIEATGSLALALGNWANNGNNSGETNFTFPAGWTELLERGDNASNGNHFGLAQLTDPAAAGALSCLITGSISTYCTAALFEVKPA